MKTRILVGLTVAVLILSAFGHLAFAETLTIPFTHEFSGLIDPDDIEDGHEGELPDGYPPNGEKPWLTATFDDGGTPGSVTMEIDLNNLIAPEFIGAAMFNLDPALDPTSLSFGQPTKTGSFLDPTINTGINAFAAAGAFGFDIQFDFHLTGSELAEDRFGAGESLIIEITGDSLTAGSFDFLNESGAPSKSVGPFIAAAHVQGIGELDELSGWVTVPEPSATGYLLSLTGLALFATAWRRRRRIAALASAR